MVSALHLREFAASAGFGRLATMIRISNRFQTVAGVPSAIVFHNKSILEEVESLKLKLYMKSRPARCLI